MTIINEKEYAKSPNFNKMGITISKKAFEILSSGIYEEKIPAIVRETVSNAIDGSKKANITTPVIVNFPISDVDDFYVQDFGIGMSIETIIEIFANYFSSDKENDNSQIGGFGLGAKTPFIYTNIFKVESTSPDDNVRRTFTFSIQKDIPEYSHLDEFDIENSKLKGTKISFKINKNEDVYEFIKGFKQMVFSSYPITLKFGDYPTKHICSIIGTDLSVIKEVTKELNNNKFCFLYKQNVPSIESANKIVGANFANNANVEAINVNIRLGDILYNYTLTNNKINKKINLAVFLNNIDELILNKSKFSLCNTFIFLDNQINGDIVLNSSREHINNSIENYKKINSIFKKSLDEFFIKSINQAINFVKSIDINSNTLVSFLLYRNIIREIVSKETFLMEDEHKHLKPILDELLSVIDNTYKSISDVANAKILKLKITKSKTKAINDINNSFFRINSKATLDTFVNFIFNQFYVIDLYNITNLIYDTLLKQIKFVNLNEPIENYKKTLINKFAKNTKDKEIHNNPQLRRSGIDFIYVYCDKKVFDYNLDEEINNINNEKIKEQNIIKEKQKAEYIKVITGTYCDITNYDELEAKDKAIEKLSENELFLVIPKTICIEKTDTHFDKVFKTNMYLSNGKNKHFFEIITSTFDILVVSDDVYNELIEDKYIEKTFFEQLFKKTKRYLSIIYDYIETYNTGNKNMYELTTSDVSKILNIELNNKYQHDILTELIDDIKNKVTSNDLLYLYISRYNYYYRTINECNNNVMYVKQHIKKLKDEIGYDDNYKKGNYKIDENKVFSNNIHFNNVLKLYTGLFYVSKNGIIDGIVYNNNYNNTMNGVRNAINIKKIENLISRLYLHDIKRYFTSFLSFKRSVSKYVAANNTHEHSKKREFDNDLIKAYQLYLVNNNIVDVDKSIFNEPIKQKCYDLFLKLKK